MPLLVDEQLAVANSRLSMVRLAMFTLRSMETWREAMDDCDKALILLAVIAISGERLTRGEPLEEPLRDLRNTIPEDRLIRCNISSVAAATGLNRETTRRKINELIEVGALERSATGRLSFRSQFIDGSNPVELVRRQLEAVVRVTNDLMREGVIKAE